MSVCVDRYADTVSCRLPSQCCGSPCCGGVVVDRTGEPSPGNVAVGSSDVVYCLLSLFLLPPTSPIHQGDAHVFVADGTVWQAPTFRIAGLYAPANGEFTTPEAVLLDQASLARLHLNARASWHGRLIGGGCDEGCQAYVMVEIQDAATGDVLPGYEKERSLMIDVDGLRLPLRWNGTATASWTKPKSVVFRIYFRDATIYSLGFG